MINDDGIYDGDFTYGKRQGIGIQTYNGGCKYEGEFMNDKEWGEGIVTRPDSKFKVKYIEGVE